MNDIKIITWDKDSVEDTMSALDNMIAVQDLAKGLIDGEIEFDHVVTEEAIALAKSNLMGEYHAILVRRMEKYIEDSEVYILTWDGEASDGGKMTKLDGLQVYNMAVGLFTKQEDEEF